MVISSAMILVRALTLLLLGRSDKKLLIAYISLDLGFYLLLKIIRQDFYHWFPFNSGVEIPLSILARVIMKVITDFTSMGKFDVA